MNRAGERGAGGHRSRRWRGATWDVIDRDNGRLDLVVGSLYMHPTDPDVLLAAAAQNNWSGYFDEFTGGVFLTDDGGASWHHAEGDAPGLTSVRFAPSNGEVVYGISGPRADSVRDPTTWATADASRMGVYLSQDGGRAWRAAGAAIVEDAATMALAVGTADHLTIYVFTLREGLLESTDGGATFAEVGQGLPRALVRSLAVDPQASVVVYAGLHQAGVWKSLDGGTSWTQSAAGPNPEGSITAIVVHPLSGNVVFASDHSSGVYLSTDFGASWRACSDGLDHRTINTLAIARDGSLLYAGVEGDGVYRMELRRTPR